MNVPPLKKFNQLIACNLISIKLLSPFNKLAYYSLLPPTFLFPINWQSHVQSSVLVLPVRHDVIVLIIEGKLPFDWPKRRR